MARRLASVPNTAPRALGMVRVSMARDDMISPEIQWTAIEDHCARHGYQLTGRLEAVGESGSQRRSPWWARLDEAVAQVEAGDFDVIVVWKFSRTARQRMRWAVAIDRVEVAGGRLESATEPLDVTTPSGRLARGVLSEFDAFQAEVIGQTWREVHARRNRAGLPAHGKPRFGYEVVDGRHRPDPELGPVLADLYRRYVAGESFFSLAAYLNHEGILTVGGYTAKGPGPWSAIGLRKMLDTGFGAGFITVRGSRQPGAHVPVIDAGTWTAYLAAREARRVYKRVESSPYVLSGLVWCSCGSKMGAAHYGPRQGAAYRCYQSTGPGAVRHPGAYVPMVKVERAVLAWLTEVAAVDGNDSAAAALARKSEHAQRRRNTKRLARQAVDVDKAIGKLTADLARGLVPESAYQAALDELTAERDALAQLHIAAEAESEAPSSADIAVDLVAHWDVYSVEHRRAALRRLIERVTVTWHPGAKLDVDITPKWPASKTT